MEDVRFAMSLQTRVTKLKLCYFGQVLRGEGLDKSIMLGMGNECRGRGRARNRWLDEIREITGLNLQKLVTATGDREQWRRLVNVVHDLTVQGNEVIVVEPQIGSFLILDSREHSLKMLPKFYDNYCLLHSRKNFNNLQKISLIS